MEAVKQQAIRLIRKLPEGATMDEILSELHFKLQVDSGLRELDAGKGISHKTVKTRLAKWLRR